MDRETAERLTKLEVQMLDIVEERKAWHKIIRDTIIKTVSWLLMAGTAGVLYGWHLSDPVRKFLADQFSK